MPGKDHYSQLDDKQRNLFDFEVSKSTYQYIEEVMEKLKSANSVKTSDFDNASSKTYNRAFKAIFLMYCKDTNTRINENWSIENIITLYKKGKTFVLEISDLGYTMFTQSDRQRYCTDYFLRHQFCLKLIKNKSSTDGSYKENDSNQDKTIVRLIKSNLNDLEAYKNYFEDVKLKSNLQLINEAIISNKKIKQLSLNL